MEIQVRPPRRIFAVGALFFLLAAAFFGWGAAVSGYTPLAILAVCCGIFAALSASNLVLRAKPWRVDDDGFTATVNWATYRYRWSASDKITSGGDNVRFDFKAGRAPRAGMGAPLTTATRHLRGSDRSIPNNTLLATEDLVALLNRTRREKPRP